MKKVELFHDNASLEQCTPLKAASVVGLQPIPEEDEVSRDDLNPSLERVWVLNAEVHLDDEGHEIRSSPYIWLGKQCSGKSTSFVAPQSLATTVRSPVTDEAGREGLRGLIDAISQCYTTNTEAALLTLGAEVSHIMIPLHRIVKSHLILNIGALCALPTIHGGSAPSPCSYPFL